MQLIFTFIFSYLIGIASSNTGRVTNWAGDRTGNACPGHEQCDSGAKLCSAPMRACTCQSGLQKPAKDTSDSNLFKQLCRQSQIDGRTITAIDRSNCLRCTLPTCDQKDYPSCRTNCNNPICVNGVQTYEMDSCPSNHQKNVAKCCMWGGNYCSCVKNGDWIDVNGAAMQRLGCGGLCSNAHWNRGTCSSNLSLPKSCSGNSCSDIAPPGDAQRYSCQQLKQWGKCNESWMRGYCCGSCANAATCRSPSSCNDVRPPGARQYSCEKQKQWGKCGESWMRGYCRRTCGKC